MGVDMQRVKEFHHQDQQRLKNRESKKTFSTVWKPKEGQNRIRIMPPWTNDVNSPNRGLFFKQSFTHWKVGTAKATFTCPRETPGVKGFCNICDMMFSLYKTKDPLDALAAKQLRAKASYTSNIVDLDDPVYTEQDVAEWKAAQQDQSQAISFSAGQLKIQTYTYGYTVYKDLMDYFLQLDVSDLENGYDLTLVKEGTTQQTTRYRTKTVPERSKFDTRGTNVMERLHNLDALFPVKSAEEMQAALANITAQQIVDGSRDDQFGNQSLPSPQQVGVRVEEDDLPPNFGGLPPSSVTVQTAELGAPSCYKDSSFHSLSEPQCVGGTDKDGEKWEKCEYFDPCHAAVTAVLKPPIRRGRGPAVKKTNPVVTPQAVQVDTDLDALAAELGRASK